MNGGASSIRPSIIRPSIIRLADIYSRAELDDEQEPISHVAFQDDNGQDYLFVIETMSAAEAADLMTHNGDMKVVDAFEAFAEAWQKRLVRKKTTRFDEDRIIVIESRMGEEGENIRCVIDGNHHVVAAVKSGKPVQFIDTSRQVKLERFSDLVDEAQAGANQSDANQSDVNADNDPSP